MSFQPQIPLTGIAGWRFLQRTQPAQQAAFEQGRELVRDIAYFTEKIGRVTSAEELVADRRLLKVALGAFGLEGEINKKAYIRKVLEEGTLDPKSFANRISDPSYAKLAKAFGFGDFGARTGFVGFAEGIVSAYKTRAFEVAVGAANEDMRFAMNFRREIADLAAKGTEGGSWFSVLGSKPLRKVFESAFNLPSEFGRLEVDRQREILRDKTSRMFGTADLAAFRDPKNVEKVIDRFLIRAQVEAGPAAGTPGMTALTLLQNASASGSLGWSNLLAARS